MVKVSMTKQRATEVEEDLDPGMSKTSSPILAIVPFVGDAHPSTSLGQLETNGNLEDISHESI